MLDEIDHDFINKQTAACKNDGRENISHTPCSSPVKKEMKHEVCNFKDSSCTDEIFIFKNKCK